MILLVNQHKKDIKICYYSS